jgi:hypothetical protein
MTAFFALINLTAFFAGWVLSAEANKCPGGLYSLTVLCSGVTRMVRYLDPNDFVERLEGRSKFYSGTAPCALEIQKYDPEQHDGFNPRLADETYSVGLK